MHSPALERVVTESGVAYWTDPALSDGGIVVAFSERTGGVSPPPYDSLNLASHVGDDPAAVARNRRRFLDALGLGDMLDRLITAEQVHGSRAQLVSHADAGSRVPAADALVTTETDLPLLLLFADCLPLVLVATSPERAIAVAHVGWRGAASGVHREALRGVVAASGARPQDVMAFIGPHIMPCHYEVGADVLSRFQRDSATISAAPGRLDLGAVVRVDLEESGLSRERMVGVPACTAESTPAFFSYRAEGITGRHGAVAVIMGGDT
ncbi:MAG: peptidoglycan editing factor PgeF [Coriobacteriia bacterium]